MGNDTELEKKIMAALEAVVEYGFIDDREATKALVIALLDQIDVSPWMQNRIEDILKDV